MTCSFWFVPCDCETCNWAVNHRCPFLRASKARWLLDKWNKGLIPWVQFPCWQGRLWDLVQAQVSFPYCNVSRAKWELCNTVCPQLWPLSSDLLNYNDMKWWPYKHGIFKVNKTYFLEEWPFLLKLCSTVVTTVPSQRLGFSAWCSLLWHRSDV